MKTVAVENNLIETLKQLMKLATTSGFHVLKIRKRFSFYENHIDMTLYIV